MLIALLQGAALEALRSPLAPIEAGVKSEAASLVPPEQARGVNHGEPEHVTWHGSMMKHAICTFSLRRPSSTRFHHDFLASKQHLVS